MRRKATIGGADKNEGTVRPAERGASGYRRFGARSALRSDVVATGRPARVATAAGVATVVALGGATFAPLAEAQPAHPALPTPTGPLAGSGSLATADAAQGTDEDVLSLLDLRHDDRDERELLRRLMALAQVIVTAIVDGQLPTQSEGTNGVVVPDDQLVEALAQLRALAEALANGPGEALAEPAPATAVPESSDGGAADGADDATTDPADDPVADAGDYAGDDTAADDTAPAAADEVAEAAAPAPEDVDDTPAATMAPAAEGGQADPADQIDDSDGTDQEGAGGDAANREEGKEAIAAAEARQAVAREAADRAGREVARQAGAGFGGCDEVPQPDSVAQDGGGVGPASIPPTTAPAAQAPAPAAPTQPVSLPATDAPVAPSSAEAEFLALLNAERAKVGLPALALDGGLQAAAAAQAGNIASAGSLFHQDLVPLLGPWRTVGENVGFGPTVSSINTALVNSPGHYANMVNPDFTHVGIGVVVTADGRVWVSQVFGG